MSLVSFLTPYRCLASIQRRAHNGKKAHAVDVVLSHSQNGDFYLIYVVCDDYEFQPVDAMCVVLFSLAHNIYN